MRKFPSQEQKTMIKSYMQSVPYIGCYAALYAFLKKEKKIPQLQVGKLVAWAVEKEFDRFTKDYEEFKKNN